MMFGKKGSLHRLLWLAYQQGRLDERRTISGIVDDDHAFEAGHTGFTCTVMVMRDGGGDLCGLPASEHVDPPSMHWWQQAKTGFERFLSTRRPA